MFNFFQAKFKGLDTLKVRLQKPGRFAGVRFKSGKMSGRAEVGYEAPYAIYVHENMAMRHPRGGQAKYLTAALTAHRSRLQNQIIDDVRRGVSTVEEALQRAGEDLLDESKKLVPVDTGFLRDSGYVKVF